MRSNTEHVIESLHTLQTIRARTDKLRRRGTFADTATHLEHMFDLGLNCDYIRPYER